MRGFLLGVSLLCNAAVASPRTEVHELRDKARKAYDAKDWRAFLDAERQLVALAPVPLHVYSLACAEALNGDREAALRDLEKVAAMEIVLPAAEDSDFASLHGDPRYEAAVKRIASAAEARGEIPAASELPRPDLIVEDLARDRKRSAWFVSSVRKRAVYVYAKGALRELAKTPWAALGIDYDPGRGVLWVATAALEEEDDHLKVDEGKTAVLELDARSGKLIARHDVEAKGAIGDLRLGPDGTAYASDGLAGIVYRIPPRGKPAVLVSGLMSPQTSAVRGKELLVADYSLGLAAVGLDGGEVRWLAAPDNVALTGIDGVALDGDDLYVVQNGLNPSRVVRLRLEGDRIASAEVLQRGGDLADPTHAVVSEGALWVLARSGWEKSGKAPLLKRLQLRGARPTGQATPVPPRPQ